MPETAPRSQFKKLIQQGRGSACELLKKYPADFADIILLHSLKNCAYDPQAEGSRAEYLYRLIRLSLHQVNLEERIIKALRSCVKRKKRYDWNEEQLFNLAKQMALHVHPEAREAMYMAFKANEFNHDNFGALEIIQLDGMDGLRFIASVIGGWLTHDPERWESDWLITYTSEQFQCDAEKELEKSSDPQVKVYLDAVLKHRQNLQEKASVTDTEITYPQIRSLIEEFDRKKHWGFIRYWAKKLPSALLEQLAADLLVENDERKLIGYSGFFQAREMPAIMIDRCIELAHSEHEDLALAVLGALKNVTLETLNGLAKESFGTLALQHSALGLLIQNYRVGDADFILALLNREMDEDAFHSLGHEVLKVYENNKMDECQRPLLKVYEETLCSTCRSKCIKLLIETKTIPQWVLKEASDDSLEETRVIIRAYCKNSGP